MRRKPLLYCVVLVCAALSSCKKNAVQEPYLYAPTAKTKQWHPDRDERRKLRKVILDEVLQMPYPDEMVALGDLYDIALQNNPTTSMTWLAAKQAAAEYGSTLSTYFPQLSFDGFYNATRKGFVFNDGLTINDQMTYGPKINLSYLIWDSGERKHNAEMYYQTLELANFSHSEEVQTLLFNVSKAYYGFLYAKANVEAGKIDKQNAEISYIAAQEKFTSGIYSNTDMLQTKTNYLQKKVQLTEKIKLERNAYVDLLTVVGLPCDAELLLGDFLQEPPQSPYEYEVEDLVDLAKKHRPDFAGMKAQVLAAEASWQKTKAEVMPKVQLDASGGTSWHNKGLQDHGNYDVQVSLSFPIFTGFYYTNTILAQENAFHKARSSLQNFELKVVQEVRTAKNDLDSAEQQLLDAKAYLEAAEEETATMIARYKRGVVTVIELLQSQAYLADALAQFTLAQKEYYVGLVNVAFSIGTLTSGAPLHWERRPCEN